MSASDIGAWALIVLGASVVPATADETFRCGGKLVAPGMTQSEVLALCGEPNDRTVEMVDVRSGPQVVGKSPVARWTYQSYSATHVLVFDGDKLMEIQ